MENFGFHKHPLKKCPTIISIWKNPTIKNYGKQVNLTQELVIRKIDENLLALQISGEEMFSTFIDKKERTMIRW
jgi:hypothetical protein